MKGQNEFTFCLEEMIEMIQFYFEKKMFKSGNVPEITDISYGHDPRKFIVKTQENDQ